MLSETQRSQTKRINEEYTSGKIKKTAGEKWYISVQ